MPVYNHETRTWEAQPGEAGYGEPGPGEEGYSLGHATSDFGDQVVDYGETALGWLGDGLDVLGLNASRDRDRASKARAMGQATWDGVDQWIPGDSAAAQAAANPDMIRAQRAAVSQMGAIAQQGYTQADSARLEQINSEQRMQERAQREAIQQQMGARGMGRSGVGVQAMLAAQQGNATRSNQQALGVQAMAQDRQMQATQALAGMSGDARKQGFSEDAFRRGQKDEATRYRHRSKERIAAGKTDQYAGAAAQHSKNAAGAAYGVGKIVEGVGDWLSD